MKKALLTVLSAIAVFVAAVLVLRRGHAVPDQGIGAERPLDSMTRDELYELAREFDIPGRSRMKKTELRTALSRAGRSG